MKLKGTRDLVLYWNDLRCGCPAPELGDLDANEIRAFRADMFMLDVGRRNEFPFRLSGTRLDTLFGEKLAGRSFVDLWRAKEATNMSAFLLNVVDAGCPIFAEVAAAPLGEPPASVELLLLPLRSHTKAQASILGLAACAEAPAWLGRVPVRHLTMRWLRVVRDEDLSNEAGERPNERVLFPQRDPSAARLFERRGHLRVYPGGR